MKKNLVLSLGLSMLFLTACTNEDVLQNDSNAEFKVESSILPTTKAPQLNDNGEGTFTVGDENALFFYTSTNENVKKFTYTYGTSYKWSDIALPETITDWKVSACYPLVQTSQPESFKWNITEQENDDLLLATPHNVKSNVATTVNLTFAHALHNLAIELKADKENVTEEDLNKAVISCQNVKPIAVVNLLKGVTVAAEGELTNLSNAGKKANFIIPAQEVGKIAIHVKIGKSEKTIQLSAHQSDALQTGQSLSIDIKVSKHEEKPDYSFTVESTTISGWGNQGQIEDSIII